MKPILSPGKKEMFQKRRQIAIIVLDLVTVIQRRFRQKRRKIQLQRKKGPPMNLNKATAKV